jgi:hypothetical protein
MSGRCCYLRKRKTTLKECILPVTGFHAEVVNAKYYM